MFWAALERVHAEPESEQSALLLWKVRSKGDGGWNQKDVKDSYWERDDQEHEKTWESSTAGNKEEKINF